MFTGLIQATGRVAALSQQCAGVRLEVDCLGWCHRPSCGESIAIDGCCLTVACIQNWSEPPTPSTGPSDSFHGRLSFDVVPQTLGMTTLGHLQTGDRVNLEHAATPQSLLGGHIVHGHVDGVGTIKEINRQAGEYRVRIELPISLMEFVVPQGSIAVAGVSLTIASTTHDAFDVALIPMTLELTSLGERRPGDQVNIELDCIAKTIVHWLRRHHR